MGDISSFNFTRDVFYKKEWNEQTTKARGLFVDTRINEIVVRGYEKWFRVNEVEETKIMNLKDTLKILSYCLCKRKRIPWINFV